MNSKTDLLLEKLSQKAAALNDAVKTFENPELLVKAAKAVRKTIPFRYRRYTTALLLLNSLTVQKASSVQPKTENPGKKPKPVTEGFVNLFVSIGKRNRISASDLSRHFGKVLDIPLTKIAAVRVLPSFSFIEIEADEAERAIKEVSGTTLANRKITVSYSTQK